jgi:chemotaxis protein histidine kinase CheA
LQRILSASKFHLEIELTAQNIHFFEASAFQKNFPVKDQQASNFVLFYFTSMKAATSRAFLLNRFREVTRDRLVKIGQALLDWEQNTSLPFLDDISRELHTIKGEARMLGEVSVGKLAHSCENLLKAAQDRSLPFATSLELLLRAGDMINYLLENPLPHNCASEASKNFCSAVAQAIDTGQLDHLPPITFHAPIPHLGQKIAITPAASLHFPQLVAFENLSAEATSTRFVPLSIAFAAFPRAVREMAKQQGKEVRLLFEQREFNIHCSILTEIHDSMVHLLRNAVDHGIETPEVRDHRCKSRRGLIRIDVSDQAGLLKIAVEDDGQGIDTLLLRKSAVSCSYNPFSSSQLVSLSESEALELVFVPHLSTCTRVTEFSGRGMGMSIVKEKIESLGGTVTIQSQQGHGTRIVVLVPHFGKR